MLALLLSHWLVWNSLPTAGSKGNLLRNGVGDVLKRPRREGQLCDSTPDCSSPPSVGLQIRTDHDAKKVPLHHLKNFVSVSTSFPTVISKNMRWGLQVQVGVANTWDA